MPVTALLFLAYLFTTNLVENPRDGGAWWAAVYGVAQSRTRLKRLMEKSLESLLDCKEIKPVIPR